MGGCHFALGTMVCCAYSGEYIGREGDRYTASQVKFEVASAAKFSMYLKYGVDK